MVLKKNFKLFLFIALCLSTGWLGSLATSTSRDTWYAALQKPPLNPPNWIFAPVWMTLYLFMAVAGWKIWETAASNKNQVRFLFAAQLCLNGIWSFLFFGLQNTFISLADIFLLWASLVVLTPLAWRADRMAGLLLVPYLIWVSFATYLNAAIWWLNR